MIKGEKNILILDDIYEDAKRVCNYLEIQFNQNVSISIDSSVDQNSISEIKEVDLIIFDINFKNGKWIEIISSIRLYHRNTPLIIFTNQVDQYYKKLCSLMGVHSFMDKTTQIEQLPVVIRKILLN
jgi:DNA-binding response OmpR family regulator